MNNETYLNHPNFGLLCKVCPVGENKDLFTTLYAQRLFFLVSLEIRGLVFDPISRSEAKLVVESRMRKLRRLRPSQDYNELLGIYQRTFQ